MDERRFDALARAMAGLSDGHPASRRTALRVLAGSALGGLVSWLGVAGGVAQTTCGKTGVGCGEGEPCCDGLDCSANERGEPLARRCCLPAGRKCPKRGGAAKCCSGSCKVPRGKKTGKCACLGNNKPCTRETAHKCCSGACRGTRCADPCPGNQEYCGGDCHPIGSACNTGEQGICAEGTLRCVNDQPACVRNQEPRPEECNGLDDDCDGNVDDGAPCPGDLVCQAGTCACAEGEKDCGGTTCIPETACCDRCLEGQKCCGGRCVPEAQCQQCCGGQCLPAAACCKGACPEGQKCCDGTTCIPETACCNGTCPPGLVCLHGGCFKPCPSLNCSAVCARCRCDGSIDTPGTRVCVDLDFGIGGCAHDGDCPRGTICDMFLSGGSARHLCTRPCPCPP